MGDFLGARVLPEAQSGAVYPAYGEPHPALAGGAI
ncbi:hypothetical protein C3999_01695 [Escherichia marmotae]|uniref:Uncharacterized protein n=1 Tax=Escherichia marmotae TaxID=1499973 RepID=A0A7Z8ZKS1_9ESCH|nr:hypothetical protein A1SC_03399 [Escherichia sp. KTE52]KAF3713473.1 hypothetical protein FM737_000247 [Escherichia marmotae]RDR33734.1 hypothetical protein C4A10_01675 [Escherichia marmotae]RDR57955.1 hypothetical protein C4A06_01804 [Escherichia marmotae]RDR89477.1 hypothetical protein C3999_01695 [Escherichia marmotae]